MVRSGRLHNTDGTVDRIHTDIENGNNSKVIPILLEEGVDETDGFLRTPLIWASFYGNLELLKWLLTQQANVNHQDRNGYSALHFVAQEKQFEAARLLLENGGNLGLQDIYGNTPVWTAVFNARGNYEVLSLFMRNEANFENVNNAGRTPRQIAETMFPSDFSKLLREFNQKD